MKRFYKSIFDLFPDQRQWQHTDQICHNCHYRYVKINWIFHLFFLLYREQNCSRPGYDKCKDNDLKSGRNIP